MVEIKEFFTTLIIKSNDMSDDDYIHVSSFIHETEIIAEIKLYLNKQSVPIGPFILTNVYDIKSWNGKDTYDDIYAKGIKPKMIQLVFDSIVDFYETTTWIEEHINTIIMIDKL